MTYKIDESSIINEKNIFATLDNVIKCNEKKWIEHVDKYSNRFLYDKNKFFEFPFSF